MSVEPHPNIGTADKNAGGPGPGATVAERHEMGDKPSRHETTPLNHQQKRAGAWKRLKKRWNRKGVVEVDMDHHRYPLLTCIREGIRDVISNHPELAPKDDLQPDDYTHVLVKNIQTSAGKTFEFCSYASSVFATLRQAVGVSEGSFLQSMAPQLLPYLEFISNSKGGQDFFLTNDKAYFLKTEKKYYVNVFLNMLGEYLQHFQQYPHSLIVKFLGLYSVKMPGQKKLYFYIMQSIFYPDERIEERYDVKGCLAGRYQKPRPPGSNILTVLKDENFLGRKIAIGSQRDWFMEQLSYDVEFLQHLGVQDYSLLVGIQNLHPDEQDQGLGDLVTRVTKSVGPQTETNKGADSQKRPSIPMNRWTLSVDSSSDAGSEDRLPQKPPPVQSRFSMIKVDSSFDGHRRLLPNSKNPLHIMDGPKYRYFLGIIDFLTLYECRQRTGRVLKNFKYACGDHSTVPPQQYGRRFLNFISDHVV